MEQLIRIACLKAIAVNAHARGMTTDTDCDYTSYRVMHAGIGSMLSILSRY